MRFKCRRWLCVLLTVLLLLPVLPSAAAFAAQTEQPQAGAIRGESDGIREQLQAVRNRLVLLYQQIRALLGLGNAAIRDSAQRLGIDLLPVPTCAVLSEEKGAWADAALLSPSDAGYHDIFALFGFRTGDGGLPVRIRRNPLFQTEQYRLSVKKDGIYITASNRRGVFCAVSTLAQLVKNGKIVAAEIWDRPAEQARGVIEGFYGQAWTHEFRLELFSFMGKYKLNTYIYARRTTRSTAPNGGSCIPAQS